MLISTEYSATNVKSIVQFLKDHYGEQEIVGAEVGVFRGENAKNLLDSLNLKKLYLIDPYRAYNDFDNQEDLDNGKLLALTALQEHSDKTRWINQPSLIGVDFVKEELDFAYLDNSHRYLDVLAEIPKWYEKIKMGAILCGDDYCTRGSYKDMEVAGAVCEIAMRAGIDIYLSNDELADWWLIKDREQLVTWI
jgi:hypothetical protein